jgi:hypothetical protein
MPSSLHHLFADFPDLENFSKIDVHFSLVVLPDAIIFSFLRKNNG